ncbi:hypothetical protein SAMN05216316_2266 [Nitrosovibrio sp. Nv6]|nr:hypothetical protein SAMN05216316_2266 [Nitrosovibrio sp. Nv6]
MRTSKIPCFSSCSKIREESRILDMEVSGKRGLSPESVAGLATAGEAAEA